MIQRGALIRPSQPLIKPIFRKAHSKILKTGRNLKAKPTNKTSLFSRTSANSWRRMCGTSPIWLKTKATDLSPTILISKRSRDRVFLLEWILRDSLSNSRRRNWVHWKAIKTPPRELRTRTIWRLRTAARNQRCLSPRMSGKTTKCKSNAKILFIRRHLAGIHPNIICQNDTFKIIDFINNCI